MSINFDDNIIYLRTLIYLAKKILSFWVNKYENLHDWKIKKTNSEKTVSQVYIEP